MIAASCACAQSIVVAGSKARRKKMTRGHGIADTQQPVFLARPTQAERPPAACCIEVHGRQRHHCELQPPGSTKPFGKVRRDHKSVFPGPDPARNHARRTTFLTAVAGGKLQVPSSVLQTKPRHRRVRRHDPWGRPLLRCNAGFSVESQPSPRTRQPPAMVLRWPRRGGARGASAPLRACRRGAGSSKLSALWSRGNFAR